MFKNFDHPNALLRLREPMPRPSGMWVVLLSAISACGDPIDDSHQTSTLQDDIVTKTSALTITDAERPFYDVPVRIVNVNSGKCLNVKNGGTADQTNVDQDSCSAMNLARQTWFLNKSGDSYQIRPGNAGNKNLDVAGNSIETANIQIYNAVTDAQIFRLARPSTPDGSYLIIGKNSGKCLDVVEGSTDNGANVQQYECFETANQRWWIRPQEHAMHLLAKHSGRCVDVVNERTDSPAPVQQYECQDMAHQRWVFTNPQSVSGTTYYEIKNQKSNHCLDVVDQSTANGAIVQQYQCGQGDHQRWSFVRSGEGYLGIMNKKSGRCLTVAAGSLGNQAGLEQRTCGGREHQSWRPVFFERRHVQVFEVAKSDGTSRQLLTDSGIRDHIQVLNKIYKNSGIQLEYDPATGKDPINSDALFNHNGKNSAVAHCRNALFTTPSNCATIIASEHPKKVVVFARTGMGEGFSAGNMNHIVVGRLRPNAESVCGGQAADTQWLAHEFGHYMGLVHTNYFNNDDYLVDTRPNPVPDSNRCVGPVSPTGTFNGTTVDTNNVMSYQHNVDPIITPQQASLVRSAAFVRGF